MYESQIKIEKMVYGISSELSYFEFQLDSAAAFSSGGYEITKENWPVFSIGAKRDLEQIAAVKIIDVQIPFTWYVFNASNNTFQLTEDGEAAQTVTIPEGNYTISEFTPALEGLLDAASAIAGVAYTYTVTYDSRTQKIAIYNNAAVTAPFTITMTSFDTSPAKMMGFAPDTAIVSQTFIAPGPVPAGDVLLPPFVINMTGANYLYINSNRLGVNVDMYLPSGTGGNSGPQISAIPISTNAGGVIDWIDPDPTKYFNVDGLFQLREVDFYLTSGRSSVPLDLNGQSFKVKLAVLERRSQPLTTTTGNKKRKA
jgi:hypothetical protein